MKNPVKRDFDGDFEAALVDEYKGYMRGGRTEDAAAVAKVLRDQYEHDVEPKKQEPKQHKQDAPEPKEPEPETEPKLERADVKAPETMVPEKPAQEEVKRGPGRPRKV